MSYNPETLRANLQELQAAATAVGFANWAHHVEALDAAVDQVIDDQTVLLNELHDYKTMLVRAQDTANDLRDELNAALADSTKGDNFKRHLRLATESLIEDRRAAEYTSATAQGQITNLSAHLAEALEAICHVLVECSFPTAAPGCKKSRIYPETGKKLREVNARLQPIARETEPA